MLKRFIPLDLAEMKESGFTPKFFETDIRQEVHKQGLQGRIDRLDVREGKNPAFRVVDYKTGSGGIGKLLVESLLDPKPGAYVTSLSPDRFTETSWTWPEAIRQARRVYETYYGV